MRSNGGRGLVSEALSPDAAEGRRGEPRRPSRVRDRTGERSRSGAQVVNG